MAQLRATTEFGSCAFSCEVFASMVLESSSHVAQRSSSRASATSFTLLSSVDVLGRTTVHCELATNITLSTVDSVGFLPRKVSILMYDSDLK